MYGKEIVAWDILRHPNLGQKQRLPAVLEQRPTKGGATRSRTQTWAGGTEAAGGGDSSDNAAIE